MATIDMGNTPRPQEKGLGSVTQVAVVKAVGKATPSGGAGGVAWVVPAEAPISKPFTGDAETASSTIVAYEGIQTKLSPGPRRRFFQCVILKL